MLGHLVENWFGNFVIGGGVEVAQVAGGLAQVWGGLAQANSGGLVWGRCKVARLSKFPEGVARESCGSSGMVWRTLGVQQGSGSFGALLQV